MSVQKINKQQKKDNNKFYKIRMAFLLTLLFLGILVLSAKTFFPFILYSVGEGIYENKDYKTAENLFKTSYLLDPSNKDAAYYWASSISKLPLIYSRQKDLFKISQLNDDSAADLLASSILQSFKVKLMLKTGENYIENALYNNQVLRWDLDSMPIKYYIDQNIRIPNYFISIVNNSFKTWERKTERLIKFKQVQNKEEANIIVYFKNIEETTANSQVNAEYQVGEAKPIISGKELKAMKIKIVTQNNLKQYFSPREIETVTKHEIGHALGIWGHSNNANNLMYYSASSAFGFLGSSAKNISPQDVNTLKLLYFMVPDISNTRLSEKEQKYSIYPPVVTQSFQSNKNFYIQKCLQNIKKRPNSCNLWVELANAYSTDKDYDKSIETLQKALELTNDKENLAIIYYNLANDSINNKQTIDAMNYALKAKALKNDYESNSLIAYIKYKQGNYKKAALDLKILLNERPNDIENALTLTDTYIKQKDYFKARATIKELLKNNPNAKNDNRLTYYKIYVLF